MFLHIASRTMFPPLAFILMHDAYCIFRQLQTRDLKLVPKSERVSMKVRRTCRRKIQERITAVTGKIHVIMYLFGS